MVRIGIVGVGFMGMIHYLASHKLRGARVTAICSRDQKKLDGDWTSIRGNFGPPGQMMNLSHLKRYLSYDEMLKDPEIDLIDICNPTVQHEPSAIAALRSGKHALVEKAIALHPDGADQMLSAARSSGKMLMVAHVLPFFPEFEFAYRVRRNNTYGKLLGGHLKRVISKPDWSAEIGDAAATGGPAVDLHIHDTHFIGLLAGIPQWVFASGVQEGGAVTYLTTNYLYGEGGPAISCSSGAVSMKARPFVHGYELYFERATLTYESGSQPLTILHADGATEQPALGSGDPVDAFTTEIQAAVDGVASGKEPAVLSGQLARDALVMCMKEIESVRSGTTIAVG